MPQYRVLDPVFEAGTACARAGAAARVVRMPATTE